MRKSCYTIPPRDRQIDLFISTKYLREQYTSTNADSLMLARLNSIREDLNNVHLPLKAAKHTAEDDTDEISPFWKA